MTDHNTNQGHFDLLLLSVDDALVSAAVNAGVDGIIVDWENQGKKLRQKNFDTQINHNTYEDLCRLRQIVPAGKLLCRINEFSGDSTLREVDRAVGGGADEIFLPMVTSALHVEKVIAHVGNAAAINILIETVAALEQLRELSSLQLKRAYIGLNDLHIQQGTPNIFYPLLGQTIADIRKHFTCRLGMGGVTYPDSGQPVRSRYLINEYARLNIEFSFLRRTFIKDCSEFGIDYMVSAIKEAYREAKRRTPAEEEDDFRQFSSLVTDWLSNPYIA